MDMETWQSLFAQRTRGMKTSDIRDAFKLAERGDIISFAGGFPSPETFPFASIAEAVEEVVLAQGRSSLQYGPTEGLYELRAYIAQKLSQQGIGCAPEGVLITNGSQQALDLISKVLLDPGDGVVVEKPAYVGGLNAIAQYEPEFLPVPIDDDGLRVDLLEELLSRRRRAGKAGRPVAKFCYTVPNFQNPSGVTLSDERRERLVELASEYGFAIVEDNPYGDLRFEGSPKRHIKSYDAEGRVLYLGSFSKVFLPGIRLGYVAGPEAVVQKLATAKQGTDLCTNTFGQKLVLECARRGLLETHLASIVEVYRKKRDLMLQALGEYFPEEVRWTYPEGGFFIWVTLPKWMNAKALLPRAVEEERVAYVSGGAFHTDGTGQNTIRLAYSQASDEELVEGIRRLGRFFRRVMAEAPQQPSRGAQRGEEIAVGARTGRRT